MVNACETSAEHAIRMLGYQIEDGRLYRIGDGEVNTRARPRLECVTREEAVELARIEHTEGRSIFG